MEALGPEAVLLVLLYCWTEAVLCDTLDLLDRFAVCGGVSVTLCPSCMKLCRISPTESHLHSPLLFHFFSLSLSCLMSSFPLCLISYLPFLSLFFSSLPRLSCLVSFFHYTFSLLFVIVSSQLIVPSLPCFITPFLFFLSLCLVSSHVVSSFIVSSLSCLLSSLSSLHFSSHHLSCFVSFCLFSSFVLSHVLSSPLLLILTHLLLLFLTSSLLVSSSLHFCSLLSICLVVSLSLVFSSFLSYLPPLQSFVSSHHLSFVSCVFAFSFSNPTMSCLFFVSHLI